MKKVILVGAFLLTVMLIACSEDKAKEGGDSKDETKKSEPAAYDASLLKLKDSFCACISAGTETRECEKEANNVLKEITEEFDLDTDARSEMTMKASELMRSCIK